ncbi:type II toxin-antitoxin system VapC family toxin [Deinococcus apachensis]|uniref:type II toxin-antitoxin system VapC family toxin n=1 Tax=Deinococcus apachensis TaxID=309886 RepID=UPI000367BBEE|nr:type II toxin-antitoxin system VapC family toxin [Deinococcus apachensis]
MNFPPQLCLDTNVLLTLLVRESKAEAVSEFLNEAQGLLVCGPVVAELRPSQPDPEDWLREYGIEVDWVMGRAVWQRVGEAHAGYVAHRRASGGGLSRRILTDYLIAAHAEVSGLPLFTLNPADYTSFPGLEVLTLK